MKKFNLSDRISPVLVKEIRQYFHSGSALIAISLLLAGQLMLLLLVPEMEENVMDRGKVMFLVLLGILLVTGFIMGGIGSLNRYMAERANRELDFSAMTTLTPLRLVWGKLLAAVVMLLLLYSLTLPFMVIAYFLRGIPLDRMMGVTLILFPILLIFAQIGLLFGSGGKRWMTGLFYGGMFLFVPYLLFFLVLGIGGLFGGGLFDDLGIPQGWLYLFILLPELSLLGLLFVLTVAVSSHVTANRMLSIRIYLFLTFLPFGFLPGLLGVLSGNGFLWDVTVTGLLSTGLAAVIPAAVIAGCEREFAGIRITRSLPRSFFLRLPVFLLSSGWGGGILFCYLMAGTMALFGISVGSWDAFYRAMAMVGIVCYFIFYAEGTVLLRRFLPKVPPWVCLIILASIFVFLPGVFGIGPILINYYRDGESFFRIVNLFNPLFLVGDEDWIKAVWWVPVFLAGAALIPLVPRIFGQFREFRQGREGE